VTSWCTDITIIAIKDLVYKAKTLAAKAMAKNIIIFKTKAKASAVFSTLR